MKHSVLSLAFVTGCLLVAQSARAQPADDCRAKLKNALEELKAQATGRVTYGKLGELQPTHFNLVFDDSLKALNDPKHKISFPDDHRYFIPSVVKRMHEPSCDDYATKTLNAMIN
jgi:hypothetical protein